MLDIRACQLLDLVLVWATSFPFKTETIEL
jgi:hypothetical protein